MQNIVGINETINALAVIFEKHTHERICVIGTMCCGKTTLQQQMVQYNCVDVDDEFWPQISEEKKEALSQKPITKEIIDEVIRLMHEKVTVRQGCPLFGIAILDCEAVVYLDIPPQLLKAHCEKRGDTTFADALYVKRRVEEDWAAHQAIGENACYYLTLPE